MSLGYAERLSYREDLGGQLGAPEYFDSPAELERKVGLLAQLVSESPVSSSRRRGRQMNRWEDNIKVLYTLCLHAGYRIQEDCGLHWGRYQHIMRHT